MNKPFFSSGLHNILLAVSILGFGICFEALFHQMFIAYDLKILAIENVCEKPLNNRCQYEYSIRNSDGISHKMSFGIYRFMDDELVVGNSIDKKKFSFKYKVNGKEKIWPFAGRYIVILLASLSMLALWRNLTARLWARENDKSLI